MIVINQVRKLDDDRVVRVLWLEEDYAIIFDIETQNVPEKINLNELYDSSEEVEDIYLACNDDEFLKPNHIAIREKSWRLISKLVTYEPEIYQGRVRGKLIREVAKQSGVDRSNIYDLIKRFWERGKVKDAFLPDFKKSGRKKIVDSEELTNIYTAAFNAHRRDAESRTLMYSWNIMKMDYFKGVPEEEIPTYHQFVKRYNERFKRSERERAKVGDKKYRKDISENLGNSTQESNAPGKRYQIDATLADVYLVSDFDRSDSIGRPVVYLCIDVFSRMITGVNIGLKAPSLEGARMTILNCLEDKEEYCARYGYKMSKEDWPAVSLPACFLGDNGEMRSKTFDNAIEKIGSKIENTGSYRGDMKGIVERKFRSLHDRIKAVVPGMVLPDFQERGAPDYRQQARLTLREFTCIVFAWIKEEHNKYIKEYPSDKDVDQAGINKTPKELWQWGVKYRPQFLKTAPSMLVRAALLPHKKASVTEKGIRLHKKLHYTCDVAMKEDWFIRVKKEKMKVDLVFNKRNLREAYIYYKGEYIPVVPTIESDLLKYSYEEIEYHYKAENKRKKAYGKNEFQAFVTSETEMQDIVKKAENTSALTRSSAKIITNDIKENQKIEHASLNLASSREADEPRHVAEAEIELPEQDDAMLKLIKDIRKKKLGAKNDKC